MSAAVVSPSTSCRSISSPPSSDWELATADCWSTQITSRFPICTDECPCGIGTQTPWTHSSTLPSPQCSLIPDMATGDSWGSSCQAAVKTWRRQWTLSVQVGFGFRQCDQRNLKTEEEGTSLGHLVSTTAECQLNVQPYLGKKTIQATADLFCFWSSLFLFLII